MTFIALMQMKAPLVHCTEHVCLHRFGVPLLYILWPFLNGKRTLLFHHFQVKSS